MLILECSKLLEPFVKLLKLFVMIMYIVSPIALIIASMLSFSKAVSDKDSDSIKKAFEIFIRRTVAVIIIMFVPTFVIFLMKLVSSDFESINKFVSCYTSTSIFKSGDGKIFENTNIAPSTCKLKIENGKTIVSVDNKQVVLKYTYKYDNKSMESSSGSITIDGEYEEVIVDINGKKKDEKIVCKKEESKTPSLPMINVLNGGEIVFSKDTETMKLKIQKRNTMVNANGKSEKGYYYLAYIWVEDPYMQNSKAHASEYPNKLQNTKGILENEVKKENLENKLVVAMNASGYYNETLKKCKEVWSTPDCKDKSCFCYPAHTTSEQKSKEYNQTQEGALVITKGVIIRNWPEQSAVDTNRSKHVTYGIDPSGTLRAFRNVSTGTEADRKAIYKQIIDSGIKNTVTFYPVVIENGKTLEWKNYTYHSNLTTLCQVNRNNFVLLSARKSINYNVAIDDFESLGCQTVVNFDGGGSVELLYKEPGGEVKRIYEGSYSDRANAEIYYFRQQ